MARISLRGVVIDFPIVNSSSRSLQLRLFQALGGRLTSHHSTVVVRALDSIDLELKDGDRLGIIGANGSGKTTLLRVFAGVYPPDRGSATIEGSISSFTDIALGMDPESTGWENIIFRCAFMGMTFEQAKRLSPTIAEFSELGEYLDLPMRTYSSGMFLRLAFAISTSIEPEILIMDEMIATGDANFIEKAKRRIRELVDKAHILAMASHDLKLVREICNKVLWLDHGTIKQYGSPAAIVEAYERASAGSPGAERMRAGGHRPGEEWTEPGRCDPVALHDAGNA
jgi:ABC-type polysaccharide/polyol phosphate transport system ATPase subunit